MISFATVTVSDSCALGKSEDKSGPAIKDYIISHLSGAYFKKGIIIPDDEDVISQTVKDFSDCGGPDNIDLLVISGGTGFGTRDVTPEAVRPLIQKEASGLVHCMLSYSLSKTPYAWLSRPVAGVRNKSLIITVPGSTKAAVECLTPLVENGLKHAIELMLGDMSKIHPSTDKGAPEQTLTAQSAAELHIASSVNPLIAPSMVKRPRNSEYAMVSMNDAIQVIAEECERRRKIILTRDMNIIRNTTLDSDLISSINMPPFRASVKDGYAVISADGSGEYPVVSAYTAGSVLQKGFMLKRGEICRVSTGGPVPDGADAVVQVEDTELIDTNGEEELIVRVSRSVPVGNDIRPIGCDTKKGDVILKRGTLMGPSELGLWLSAGAPEVSCYMKPTVSVISTGNELWAPDLTGNSESIGSNGGLPPDGMISDSNGGMLKAAFELSGSVQEVKSAGIAPDDFQKTVEVIRNALLSSDLVVSTGGISMGELDYVKAALIYLGAKIHFGRVCMKPGKPTTFATLKDKLFFALPGNPVSAMVCTHVFVYPAFRVLRGLSPDLPMQKAVLAHNISLDKERQDFQRCVLKTNGVCPLVASTTGIQASHRLASMMGANGLIRLPMGSDLEPSLAIGSVVDVIIIGEIF
eukprot:Tbor_TRINITY_DN5278_c0_g1::TRINITY_DN5278_c0_g1_i1::g.16301::m.16301/K15376/GPHN; gephyrin